MSVYKFRWYNRDFSSPLADIEERHGLTTTTLPEMPASERIVATRMDAHVPGDTRYWDGLRWRTDQPRPSTDWHDEPSIPLRGGSSIPPLTDL